MNKTGIFIISLFLSSCMFIGLNEDVKQLQAATSISGTIALANDSATPIVITLSLADDIKNPLRAYTVVYGSGDFFFSVPEGNYYLLAFEDSNHDFTLQEDERVGWYGDPSPIVATSGQAFSATAITLREPQEAKHALPELYIPEEIHKPVNFNDAVLGEVVDTSAFKPALGPLGMWDPVKFHLQGHSGIYFLEPYDSNKIPVLFVHGISGSGHDWLYLIEQLDRQHFQPWIVQYPSGMRLNLLSKSLSQTVNELRANYNYEKLAVIAHSMGGLVARGFINEQLSNDNNNTTIKTFVTISTPWLGHSAASQGAKHAPVAVPSWFDMAPGSPYLKSLHQQALPAHSNYYLLFGHKGKGGGILGHKNSDGTVTLASQLAPQAQEEALKVIGYDENHTSILRSAKVANKLAQILEQSLHKE